MNDSKQNPEQHIRNQNSVDNFDLVDVDLRKIDPVVLLDVCYIHKVQFNSALHQITQDEHIYNQTYDVDKLKIKYKPVK